MKRQQYLEAKNMDEDKIKMDHGKLAREAKDVLDRLALLTVDGNLSYAWKGISIQLTGLQAQISTMHLHDSGLYVFYPGSQLAFPRSPASFERFFPTMKALLQLRVELETMGMMVRGQWELANEKRNSLGTSFGRPASALPEPQAKRLKKCTGYSPPPRQ